MMFLSARTMHRYLPPKSVAMTHDQPNIIPDFALVSSNDVQPANKLQTTNQARSGLRDVLVSPD